VPTKGRGGRNTANMGTTHNHHPWGCMNKAWGGGNGNKMLQLGMERTQLDHYHPMRMQ